MQEENPVIIVNPVLQHCHSRESALLSGRCRVRFGFEKLSVVIAGLDPAIQKVAENAYVFHSSDWIAGSRPAMTIG
jgi:hypothetical protein